MKTSWVRGAARYVAVALLMTSLAVIGSTSSVDAAGAGDEGWVVSADGTVTAFGGAPDYGDATGIGSDAVAIVATPSGLGYFVAFADGTVVARGDAVHQGDVSGLVLTRPIVDMALSGSGGAYMLLGADGGVFVFGNLPYLGSAPEIVPADQLDAPAVALVLEADGQGYSIVFADGGIFTFGSADFYGSIPGVLPAGASLDALIVGAVASSTGGGYGMVGGDGGVFAFGDYRFIQSLAASGSQYAAMDVTDSGGYVMVSTSGDVRQFEQGPSAFEVRSLGVVVVDLALRPEVQPAPTTTTTTTAPPTTAPPTTAPPTTAAPTTAPTTQPPTTQPPVTTSPPTTQGGTFVGSQFSVFNGIKTDSANANDYWNDPGAGQFPVPNFPDSMFGPIDYVNGSAYMRVEVFSKESSRPVLPQFCLWYGGAIGFSFETCADEFLYEGNPVTGPGVYYYDLGTPANWWRLNGVYNWGVRPQNAQVMVKDGITRSLLMSTKCGGGCFTGGDVTPHDEISFSAEIIFVQAGSIFQVPGTWAGSPF